jgi:hypothetical protein
MVSEGSFLFLGEQATRCLAGPPYYRVGVYVCQPWQHDYFSVIYQAIGRSVGHLSSGVVVVDPFFFFEKKKKKEGRGQWTRTRAGTTKPAGQRRCVVHVLVPILSSLSDR